VDDGELLEVLAAEDGNIRGAGIEELEYDGGDAAEVSGTVFPAETLGDDLLLDPGGVAGCVEVGPRREDDVDSPALAETAILVKGARVKCEVLALAELGRVDEDGNDAGRGLAPCHVDQREMALV
jgi:hypothetical protein